MPVMDGLTALQYIMMESPRPVVMISSLTQEGALTSYEALELGAVDFVGKPGGTISRDIEKVVSHVTRSGLVVRGFYGEGSDVLGNLFQLSNQNTLGVSEGEILNQIDRVTREVIEKEAESRQRLVDEAADMIEDKIWRAYGILKHARVLTSDEVMNLLSAVRLGHAMKIIDFLNIALINEILLLSQPAHLQKYYGHDMDNNRRDFVRAQMVREKLRQTSV